MDRSGLEWTRGYFILVAASALCAALAVGRPASAELLYYDPFLQIDSAQGANPAVVEPAMGEYAVGPVAGQDPTVPAGPNPPAGPWGTNQTFFDGAWFAPNPLSTNGNIVEQGMSYVGAPALGGSLQGGADTRARRTAPASWDGSTEGTFYMGFLVNFGTLGEGGAMGYRSVEIGEGGSTIYLGYNAFFSTLGAPQQNPATARLFLGTENGGITKQEQILPNSPLSFNADGKNHLVVLRFDLTTTGDTLRMFLDPTTLVEPDIPGASRDGMDFMLGSMGIANFGGTGIFPTFDELRIGTLFADVMPDLPRPGDTDDDDDTDQDDLDTITEFWGQTVTCGPSCGDVAGADGRQGSDNFVGLADFRLWKDWRNIFGSGAGTSSGSAHAPEPSSAILAFLAATALVAYTRRAR